MHPYSPDAWSMVLSKHLPKTMVTMVLLRVMAKRGGHGAVQNADVPQRGDRDLGGADISIKSIRVSFPQPQPSFLPPNPTPLK